MKNFLIIEETDSTNELASKLLKEDKITNNYFTICSRIQKKGKGIYQNKWHSSDYKNLTFSMVFYPKNLKVQDNFLLSMSVSLGICDFLEQKKLSAKIKWPNDILLANKKICGILIENNIKGDLVTSSILGVGFNLNQENFPEEIGNIAISLKMYTGNEYNFESELKGICGFITNRLKRIDVDSFEKTKELYFGKLFKFGEMSRYKTQSGEIFAEIIDLGSDGRLVLKEDNGNIREFYFKELVFL